MVTFLMPLTPAVWASFFASAVFMTLAFLWTAKVEENIVRADLREWSTLKTASWYTYGTLCGESITRDTKSEGASALR